MRNQPAHVMRSALYQSMHAPKPVARLRRLGLSILLAVGLWLFIMAACFVLVRLAGG